MKPFIQYLKESDWEQPVQLYQKPDGSWYKMVDADSHGELPPASVPATASEVEAWLKLSEANRK